MSRMQSVRSTGAINARATDCIGGVIHTYQKYDPQNFPSPTQPPPDLVSGAFEHLLAYGEPARADRGGTGPRRPPRPQPDRRPGPEPRRAAWRCSASGSGRSWRRTRPTACRPRPPSGYRELGDADPSRPRKLAKTASSRRSQDEQLYDLERLWYRAGDEQSPFARQLVQLIARLGDKYQIDELAAKYEFTGRTPLTIPQALEIKEELETIDRLLEAAGRGGRRRRRSASSTWRSWPSSPSRATSSSCDELARQIEEYLRELAEQQGLEQTADGLPADAQGLSGCSRASCWSGSSATWQASRTGRHQGPVVGEGAVELQQTKPYEFGDSLANMDIPGSLINAMLRDGAGLARSACSPTTSQIHRTRNTPKCATVVLLDMSGSMRYDGLYVNVKRMGLALDGLIRREYPGDYLQFIEMYTFAKPRHASEIATLLPKPVTIFDSGRAAAGRHERPGHQRVRRPAALHQHPARPADWPGSFLAAQDTPNRQIILITDGLPTAHFEGTASVPALSARPADRSRPRCARAWPLPPRGDHDQHLPAAELVAVARGRAVRLPPGRVDRRPRLLHRRQGPRPLRRLGLSATPPRDRGVKGGGRQEAAGGRMQAVRMVRCR